MVVFACPLSVPTRQRVTAGDIRANSARQVVTAAGDGVTASIRADHYITDAFGSKPKIAAFSAMRSALADFGITTIRCSTCQRRTT